jgi:hypothetical protein
MVGWPSAIPIPEPEVPEIAIIDTTIDDHVKFEEKRKRIKAEQELNLKIKRSNRWKRDLVIPELKVGDRVKMVVLDIGVGTRNGAVVTYHEPIEVDFLVEKVYVHDDEPEARRVWYGGICFGNWNVRFRGTTTTITKQWRIFPRAHILTVGKGLESIGYVKEREVANIELDTPKKNNKPTNEISLSLG